jgi:hypothetical protein
LHLMVFSSSPGALANLESTFSVISQDEVPYATTRMVSDAA